MKTLVALAMAAAMLAVPAQAGESPVAVGPYSISIFDPANYSQEPTECDRLAAHGEDPNAVAPGQSRSTIDFDKALPACEAAVAADPTNPRLRYLLGRLNGYLGNVEAAAPHRTVAVNAGYPQSLFVVGWIHLNGMAAEQDTCLGARLIELSSAAGRFAGQVGYPALVLAGRFDGCDVASDNASLMASLERAAKHPEANDYYQSLLVDSLMREVAARMAAE